MSFTILAGLAIPAYSADILNVPSNSQIYTQPAAHIKIGILRCEIEGGFGYILGSSKLLSCNFQSAANPAYSHQYSGQILKVGADIGYTSRGKLIWAVFAPTYDLAQSDLDGIYVGLSGEASLGVGVGVNMLIGSFNESLNLIPINTSGTLGMNIAGGLGAVTLTRIQ